MKSRGLFTQVLALMIASIALLTTGCQKKPAISELNGTWDVVEVNGVATKSPISYLTFATQTGVVGGFLGCNNISGKFNTYEEPGELDVDDLALTASLCEYTDEELTILNALDHVDEFRLNGDIVELLTDDTKRVILKLKRRSAEIKEPSQEEIAIRVAQPKALPKADLVGRWEVTKVGDFVISEQEGLIQVPYLEFDLERNEVTGNTSCNTFLLLMEFDEMDNDYDPTEIDFEVKERTTVTCDNMDINNSVINALDETDSFGVLGDGSLILLDDGVVIMTLVKK